MADRIRDFVLERGTADICASMTQMLSIQSNPAALLRAVWFFEDLTK
jgi:hypothetical protein